jgi:hypothetical protein
MPPDVCASACSFIPTTSSIRRAGLGQLFRAQLDACREVRGAPDRAQRFSVPSALRGREYLRDGGGAWRNDDLQSLRRGPSCRPRWPRATPSRRLATRPWPADGRSRAGGRPAGRSAPTRPPPERHRVVGREDAAGTPRSRDSNFTHDRRRVRGAGTTASFRGQ